MYKNELQQAIRFQISQLSALNGQADFEKLSLYYARARIHLNILPATGPVQAGGDQGRDFETFHSYLSTRPDSNSYFLGNFSKNPVAFACSLEKEPIKAGGKIFQDVKTIMESGSQVERIYFFSGHDIPVAKRHKTQAAIKKQFKVELEIIDAQALSLHLTDGDLFWIAIQYLKIPSEYYPARDEKGWYTKLLDEYKKRDQVPETFEEFTEIKSAVRHIYKSKELKSDLSFWLPKLDLLINSKRVSESLQRKSIYEKYVASLVGLNNIEGQEENIKIYFSNVEEYTHNSELEDAQILLSFCVNSKRLIGHNLSEEYLAETWDRLNAIVSKKLKTNESIDTKCGLIEIQAGLILNNIRSSTDFLTQLNSYFEKLTELLKLLPKTHYYSLSRLSDRTNEIIERFLKFRIDISKLETFASKLDEILNKKGGRDIVADKLRTRSIAYMNNKEYLKAINALHELKIKWFKHDSLDGAILTCLLLADSYRKLNLFFASKYYALIAAYLAFQSKDESLYHRMADGISIAADVDYVSGSWLNFMDLTDFLIMLHYRITKDFDVFDHDDTYKILFYPSVVEKSCEMLLPEAKEMIEKRMVNWGFIRTEVTEIKKEITDKMNFKSQEDFFENLTTQIWGKLFNDVGAKREIDFNAIGCNWHFEFENNYLTNSIAEEFISMLQIILADISQDELYVIQTEVRIHISVSKTNKPNLKRMPSNDEITYEVSLPEFKGKTIKELQDHEFHYFVTIQSAIHEISLLPIEEYKKHLGKKFAEHMIAKATFGRPYAELYQHFISETDFENSKRYLIENNLYPSGYIPQENKELKWNDTQAPKYDRKKEQQAISNRMKNLQMPVSVTLPILKKSPEFMGIVKNLRQKGYLDWQILHSLATIIVNYKARFTSGSMSEMDLQQTFFKYFQKDEKEWYKEIPMDLLTEERLEQDLTMIFVLALLPGFGLQQHSQTPNGKAILKLLKQRFNFFEDGKEIVVF